MKSSSRVSPWIVAGVALLMGVATVGCGPQKKYCPDASDGICPEPTVDSGSNPPPDAGDDRGSIYIEAGR